LFKIRLKTQLNGTGILSFPPFWRGKQLIPIILIFISSISAIVKYALLLHVHNLATTGSPAPRAALLWRLIFSIL